MPDIPRDPSFDSTLALVGDPYRFISRRCRELNTDLFQTRLTLRKAICMTGPTAAELFYDETRFARRGVIPRRFKKTLLGQGGVQGLDDEAHRHRKRMFMSLMSPERIHHIGRLGDQAWELYARKWAGRERVAVYHEACEMLTRVACTWAGVPLDEPELPRRTRDLVAMFHYAGAIGFKHWRSRQARRSAERWIENVIREIRTRKLTVSENCAAFAIALHRGIDGQLLDTHTAAVELLNILRPIVAVAVYFTLAALALHDYPANRDSLRGGAVDYPLLFAQEVRRFYPFFPAVGAKVRYDFEWNGYRFVKDTPAILDLYGTNHDTRTWDAPQEFQPERFLALDPNPYNFIPQGGGGYLINHRCAGEPVTLELLQVAAAWLSRRITYDVPPQELELDFSRTPALPRSRFVVTNVRMVEV